MDSALIAAFKAKFKSPKEVLTALGMDASLLEKAVTPPRKEILAMDTAFQRVKRLRRPENRAAIAALLASDADPEQTNSLLEALEKKEGKEGGEDEGGSLDPNASLPNTQGKMPMSEFGKDAEEEEEPDWEDRAHDARRALGGDETEEQCEAREKRQAGEDAARFYKRMGRDETPEQCQEREEAEAEDRRLRRAARDALWRRRAMDARRLKGGDESPEEQKDREEKQRERDAEDRRIARDARMAKRAEDRAKREADDRAAADLRARTQGAADQPPPFKGMPRPGGKQAMDEATVDKRIQDAVKAERAEQRAIHAALEKVKPITGILTAADFDTASQVYGRALAMDGVDTKTLHPSAFEPMVDMALSVRRTRAATAERALAGGDRHLNPRLAADAELATSSGIPSLHEAFKVGQTGRA